MYAAAFYWYLESIYLTYELLTLSAVIGEYKSENLEVRFYNLVNGSWFNLGARFY